MFALQVNFKRIHSTLMRSIWLHYTHLHAPYWFSLFCCVILCYAPVYWATTFTYYRAPLFCTPTYSAPSNYTLDKAILWRVKEWSATWRIIAIFSVIGNEKGDVVFNKTRTAESGNNNFSFSLFVKNSCCEKSPLKASWEPLLWKIQPPFSFSLDLATSVPTFRDWLEAPSPLSLAIGRSQSIQGGLRRCFSLFGLASPSLFGRKIHPCQG